MQQRVVGQRPVGPDPQALVGLPGTLAVPGQLADVALVDGVGPVEPVDQLLLPGLESLEERRQLLGWRDLGHGELVLEPLFGVVERGLQVEDGTPVLNGHHAPGREGAAVADAVDLVEDRHGGVAGAQEVRVQRVHPPVLHGSPGRHQRLAGDLTAEDALALLVELGAPEDVDLNGLEVEQVDQEVKGRAHGPMFAGRRLGREQGTAAWLPLPCGVVTDAIPDDELRELVFPEGFTWGVATAAHQIEGGNVNNDWWDWEHNPSSGTLEPSGDACDSFHRWREDVALVADMGLGAYRFSLEWSRIEPAEGEFSVAALEHYRRMCAACHGAGHRPGRHLPPLHLAALAGGAGRLGVARRSRALRPLREPGEPTTWATWSAGPAPSTSPTWSRSWATSKGSTRRA